MRPLGRNDDGYTTRASRLRRAVEKIGTQAKAAELAKVSERTMRRYLAGKSEAPSEVLQRIAEASGYELSWILDGARARAPQWSAFDDTGLQDELEGATQAYLRAREAWPEPQSYLGELIMYLQLALAPQLRVLYRRHELPLPEVRLQEILREVDTLIGEGLPDPPKFHPDHWHGLVEIVLASHAAALGQIAKK